MRSSIDLAPCVACRYQERCGNEIPPIATYCNLITKWVTNENHKGFRIGESDWNELYNLISPPPAPKPLVEKEKVKEIGLNAMQNEKALQLSFYGSFHPSGRFDTGREAQVRENMRRAMRGRKSRRKTD